MIQLVAAEHFDCSLDTVKRALQRLDHIYPLYCPEEHLTCTYLKGHPLLEGSILAFEEYIAGKKHHLTYRVDSIVETSESTTLVLRAMFPRSLFNIHVIFQLVDDGDGVEFSRMLSVGYRKPILGTCIDRLFFLVIGREYYEAMQTHNREDLQQLKDYLEHEC
ncbi:hypothetical protein GF339_14835 [candidate division KSB3 bacterium]|uniref:Uncharacterized protein n=1 Tax=candidate division KSB3 bacterium TaxID=2044937 RepID=A0A9D5Q6H8_9BACT|nr:hypothetical protein [candidate division KSB3 bacterium]MBD3325859.1 hypothetical protein [candidate division KSB3 bacterium]